MDSAKLKYLAEAQPKQRRRVEISESVYEFQTDQAGGHGSHQGRNDGLSSTYSYSLGRPSNVRMSSLNLGSDSAGCNSINAQHTARSESVDGGTMAQGQITPGGAILPGSSTNSPSNSDSNIHTKMRHEARGKMYIQETDITYTTSNLPQECKHANCTTLPSALSCYEIASVKSQGMRQYSEHTEVKEKLLRDDQLFPQQKVQCGVAKMDNDTALDQRINKDSSQVGMENKRNRTTQDNVREKIEHYENSLSLEMSGSYWKRAKTHQNTLEYTQSSNAGFSASEVGVRGGGRPEPALGEDISPNADEDSEIWREVCILPSQDHPERTQEDPSSLGAAELDEIGYIANCDKRDPEVVRTFHKSMMQSIPISIGHTSESTHTTIVNTSVDGRTVKPSNLGEVRSLQEALEPSRQSFSHLVGQTAPSSLLWDDYLSQWNHLKRRLTEVWVATGRQGYPPNPTKLERWDGQIRSWHINPVWTTPNPEPAYTRSWTEGGSGLAKQQMQHAHELHENVTQELREAKEAEHPMSENARAGGPLRQNKAVKPVKYILAAIVATDPDKFVSWLATKGREHYNRSSQTQNTVCWRDYCDWYAPSRFEFETHSQNRLEPGRVDRTNTFHDDSPVVTSREACQAAIRKLNAIKNKDVFMGADNRPILEADVVEQGIRGGALDRRAASDLTYLG